jgi:hypothetical protein
MSVKPFGSATASRRRRSWLIFWAVSAVALGTCFVATLRSSGTTGAGLVLMGGLIVVGIAAALVASIVSSLPDQLAGGRGMGGGLESGGSGGGGFDGGGGDCGG